MRTSHNYFSPFIFPLVVGVDVILLLAFLSSFLMRFVNIFDPLTLFFLKILIRLVILSIGVLVASIVLGYSTKRSRYLAAFALTASVVALSLTAVTFLPTQIIHLFSPLVALQDIFFNTYSATLFSSSINTWYVGLLFLQGVALMFFTLNGYTAGMQLRTMHAQDAVPALSHGLSSGALLLLLVIFDILIAVIFCVVTFSFFAAFALLQIDDAAHQLAYIALIPIFGIGLGVLLFVSFWQMMCGTRNSPVANYRMKRK